MGKKIVTLIALLTVVCVLNTDLQAQEKIVSGVVTDTLNTLLPGVSVLIKGTEKGTATDLKGKYSLKVPKNATLRFLYIGHNPQEIAVENRQTINVVMKEASWLTGKDGIEPAKPINLTQGQREKAKDDNRFAFKMFREISKQEGENTFFSPLSLNMALGMLYNGSSGSTRSEIVESLGFPEFSESEINEYYQKISQALLAVDPSTDFSITNSIEYSKVLSVKNNYIETCKKYFNTEIQAFDSDDPMMHLINTTYFKGKWKEDKKFDKAKTKLDGFTMTNNQKKKVNMMEQTTSLSYYADEYLQCVELSYGNEAFSTIVILPPENMNIDQLIEHLDNDKYQNAVNGMRSQRVWLKLPRFKIECDFSLNQPTMNVGMNQIFSKRNANFENIADIPMYVSDIKQKTFVEVNEEGAEAIAKTEIIMIGYGVQKAPEIMHFFVNRPFLFLIKEKSTGVVLFIGRIDNPVE